MDDKKTKKSRIAELIDKIYHAENARDHYRKTHPILSEMNSYYIDTLKSKLKVLVFSEQE